MVLAALLSCAVTMRLGFWQLERLEQRREVNFQLGSRLVAEPVRLPGPVSKTPPEGEALRELEYRPVRLRGYWDFGKERALPNQFWERELGLHLVAPFALEDGSGTVLIDRGWIPAEMAAPSEWAHVRPPQRPLDVAEVQGHVRLSGPSALTTIRRELEREGLTDLLPFHVQEAPPISSIGVRHEQPLPYKRPPVASIGEGVHAIAAAQWFVISAIIVVGMVSYLIQRRRPPRAGAVVAPPLRAARERAAAPGLPRGR
jgi:surfeit locus 1 family protein